MQPHLSISAKTSIRMKFEFNPHVQDTGPQLKGS